MGALFGGNADRQWGYKIGDKIVPPSIDRIDGGGPGRSGPRFEGGGLLSDIGNALMRPYGYRDRQAAMQAMRPNARPQGLLTATPTYRGPAPGVETVDYPPIPRAAPRVADRPDYMDMEQPILSAQRARLMQEEYFNRLRAMGIDVDNITPVGQPMTGQDLMAMSNVMSQTGTPRIVAPAGSLTQTDAAAPALRRAAGTPAASLSAVEQDPYFQYLVDAGVSDFAAQKLADDTSWGGMQLRKAFETTGAIPDRPLSVLLRRHGR